MVRLAETVLALDSGSPLVSVAVARDGVVLARASVEIRQSSTKLLEMVDRVLGEAELHLEELSGLLALQGPGSFTGLRVGLATVLGLHQALVLPATALPTLRLLASLAPPPSITAVGAVDALREEWFVQRFRPGELPDPLGEPECLPVSEISSLAPCTLVGFGIGSLRQPSRLPQGVELVEPGPLAPVAARLATRFPLDWNPKRLTRPLYLRGAAVTLPKT
jgi:tRNA threonylcarbamoyladenosine biosynthesis protein TsaB